MEQLVSSSMSELTRMRERLFLRFKRRPLEPLLHNKLHHRPILRDQFGTIFAVSSQITGQPLEQFEPILADEALHILPCLSAIFRVRSGEDAAVFGVRKRIREEFGTLLRV